MRWEARRLYIAEEMARGAREEAGKRKRKVVGPGR
jgi:hypothetical protein